ncbi:DNA-3-methyladenine glycosylase I [Paenibacillus aurantius]|uniref:DNA-3-methyladenine glycosylase I n=1 Tax=Paenibacillus aurantius TaxID=2918900 RepID=A0AA96LF36_9BACL|nr:DNA-3-methyladenine glycosylase I [Paenibacillus aurantius]WNQ10936.1 DNA-3-methyladenine glycosylase I [Paenibacillus aurantius]
MLHRCGWVNTDPLYIRYHDEEWGVPVRDSRKLFELLCLEGAQAGLSWYTILKKREAYRVAFDGFDPGTVSRYGEEKLEELQNNPGIVRNRLKIRSVVRNAQAYLALEKEEGPFSDWIWAFTGGVPLVNHWTTQGDVPGRTELSDRLSKALQKRGFSFVGSTICYSFLQAAGLIDDHVETCFKRTGLIEE